MEKIVITIHPSTDDGDAVLALEALEQGAYILRLLDAVGRSVAHGENGVAWRLIKASTNSPLTLELGVDESTDFADVDSFVVAARDGLTSSLRDIAESGALPDWLHEELRPVARNVFARSRDGLGSVDIGNGNGKRFTIDRAVAEKATTILDAAPSVSIEAGKGDRALWGEVEGVIVAVATWYGKPAFRIWSRQIVKPIPVIIPEDLVDQYGNAHTLKDVWSNRRVAVRGQLIYRDNVISRVLAQMVRDVPKAAQVDIDLLRDPDFTGGLDPVEYLRRFYEGELVG
ncbi:MAG: hypothetical protein IPJ78_18885 [Gemmatimonadetes bacterium]|nr:hypothetical protein [Gemmatimonadota bacterium]